MSPNSYKDEEELLHLPCKAHWRGDQQEILAAAAEALASLEVFADPLYEFPPLGAVLPEPLRASLIHFLGDGSERRQRLTPDAGLLP